VGCTAGVDLRRKAEVLDDHVHLGYDKSQTWASFNSSLGTKETPPDPCRR
jgi:hypothetical protein